MRLAVMIKVRASAFATAFGFMASAVALAQVDRTGTGTGPLDAAKAPNTTAVGQTKPPSRDASPTSQVSPEERSAEDKKLDDIEKVICASCQKK
jgi:hypothetical protein